MCGICHEPMSYAEACVDHCHKTNQIRDLVHNGCNAPLGHYEAAHDMSNPDTQMRAAYIAKHSALAASALTIEV